MTYTDCLNELEKHGLKEPFIKCFEHRCTPDFMKGLQELTTINSTASLLRVMIAKLRHESVNYYFWVDVLQYLMQPDFNKPDFYQQGWQMVSFQNAQQFFKPLFEQGICIEVLKKC